MKRIIAWSTAVLLLSTILGGSLVWHLMGFGPDSSIEGRAVRISDAKGTPWTHYGGDPGGMRFVDASEVTAENVAALKIAWRYQTGSLEGREEAVGKSTFQVTPIFVEERLILCTPFNEVIALSPGNGEELWRFDAAIDEDIDPGNGFTCRGVAYWQDDHSEVHCGSRIFMGTADARLISLDAGTGQRCRDFGFGGELSIGSNSDVEWPGEFQITSAPTIAGDIVIVGSSISDNRRVAAPAGTVRAYDVRTGESRWSFDPVPRTAHSAAASTWGTDTRRSPGHANVWSTMSYDPRRGLIFLPTSSASPDFFGGLRPGDNRYTNSVVALDAMSGAVVWDFQTVHHDVWDYDLPAQPGLYRITRSSGASVDVVVQATKTGLVFVLDRDTGKPVIEVEERNVPQGAVAGEALSLTQPFPLRPPPLVPNQLSASDAFGITLWDRLFCRYWIGQSRSEGLYTPPSLQGTVLYPFTGGGANWGSTAYDPSRNLLVVNMSSMPHLVTLLDKTDSNSGPASHDVEYGPMKGAPYAITRELMLSVLGLPCSPPPWGILAAVDLDSGGIVWRKPFGSMRRYAAGLDIDIGMPNLGGPMITASGLIFIGATFDDAIRAFDIETGRELWQADLPAGGQATPMSYTWQGRQYVVIAAGGHKDTGLPHGDTILAFALSEN